MIDVSYVGLMADYNQWQNRAVVAAADTLDEAAREADRGAFFGSLRRTLSHILWADLMWLHRFTGSARPEGSLAASPDYARDWEPFRQNRAEIDRLIVAWSRAVDPAWLAGDLEWRSGLAGGVQRKPCGVVVAHFFNHQTHHRGQVHAMLTAAGATTQPTDLAFMP